MFKLVTEGAINKHNKKQMAINLIKGISKMNKNESMTMDNDS